MTLYIQLGMVMLVCGILHQIWCHSIKDDGTEGSIIRFSIAVLGKVQIGLSLICFSLEFFLRDGAVLNANLISFGILSVCISSLVPALIVLLCFIDEKFHC